MAIAEDDSIIPKVQFTSYDHMYVRYPSTKFKSSLNLEALATEVGFKNEHG